MFKKIVAIAMLVAMLFVVAACGNSGESTETAKPDGESKAPVVESPAAGGRENTILLGFLNPLSGENAVTGLACLYSNQLGIKEINDAGGLLGKQLDIVAYDDLSDTDQAVSIFERLINEDKVDAILGTCISGNDLAGGQLVEDAKLVAVCPGTATSWLEQGWTYLFRPTLSVKYNIVGIANAIDYLNIKKVALFYCSSEFGVNGGQSFKAWAAANGIEILAEEQYDRGDTDYTAQMTKLSSVGADALYFTVENVETGAAVKQARQNGFTSYILGDQLFSTASCKTIAGSAMKNVIFSAPVLLVNDPSEALDEYGATYFENYREMHGELPQAEQAMRAYDGIYLLAEAINRAGTIDGEATRDAFWTINDFKGLAGGGNTNGFFDYTAKDGDGLQQAYTWWDDENGKDWELKTVIDQLEILPD